LSSRVTRYPSFFFIILLEVLSVDYCYFGPPSRIGGNLWLPAVKDAGFRLPRQHHIHDHL
jgi:hypothetical protein